MSIVAVIPTCRVTGSSSLATAGGTSSTVTAMSWEALDALFVAVTVTVIEPAVTPVTDRIVPSRTTVAVASDEPVAA